MLRLATFFFFLGLVMAPTASGNLLPTAGVVVSTGPLLAPLESAANSQLSSAAASLKEAFPDVYTPPQSPVPMPPLNPMTPLRPGLILRHLIKRCIMAIIRIVKMILHRFQGWVVRTSDYLELLEARNIFGPFFSRLLHRIVRWMRSFVSQNTECIGRVLCEMSDQASAFLPTSLKQVLLIYFSANQEASFYYQPLANGFVSGHSNCARLYDGCNQAEFLRGVEHMNITVPEFTAREEDELVAQIESDLAASNEVVMSAFGRSVDASLPVAKQVVPAVLQKNVVQQTVQQVVTKVGKV